MKFMFKAREANTTVSLNLSLKFFGYPPLAFAHQRFPDDCHEAVLSALTGIPLEQFPRLHGRHIGLVPEMVEMLCRQQIAIIHEDLDPGNLENQKPYFNLKSSALDFGQKLSYVILYVFAQGPQGPIKHCVLGLADWTRYVVWPVFDPSRLVLPVVGYRGMAILVPSDWIEVESAEGPVKSLHETGHTVIEVSSRDLRESTGASESRPS